MSSPGQKRGSCGHSMASFDGHSFCARCRDKGKGKDPYIETPANDCKFCLALTLEQLPQLATPSSILKKQKWEARKLEATLSKDSRDSTLVDPSTVAVIGAVSESGTVTSPTPVVPEKKVKKDKPSTSKAKKSSDKPCLWLSLSSLLCNQLFLLIYGLPPLTLHQLPFRTLSLSFNHLQGALALTPLQLCIGRPASLDLMFNYLQSALERASLLFSICHPASSDPTDTIQDLPHISTLVSTPLLEASVHQPA